MVLSFVMFFITIPIGMIFVAAKVYGESGKLSFVLGKSILSFFIYVVFSVVIPLLALILYVGPDPKPGRQNFGLVMQTCYLLAIAAYGFLGWLLCSFINGKLIKSYSEFNLSDEKPQSLFPKNY